MKKVSFLFIDFLNKNQILLNLNRSNKIFNKYFDKILIKLCLIVFLLNIQSAVGQNLLIQDFNFTGNLTANGWTSHSAQGTNPI